MLVIARYHEIALKGRNRPFVVDKLARNLREVVHAVEPGILASPEAGSGASGPAMTTVWHELSKSITERLGSVTLEAIASEAGAPMYFI
jgi:DNA-binding IscR family transcriptional regulator